uniref:Uncharacterized protein n=1 Tax=Meloidogyne enterolobii TaxID=390850 RepID=A0A6V7UA73_MELEN|nr:unnamed protein product [Meloidogyne enterolobii]
MKQKMLFEKQNNLIKNNITNDNISRPTNLLLLPTTTTSPQPSSSSLKSLITPSSLLPPPPINNQSKSLPSSLLPSPILNSPSIPPPFSSSLNSESSPSSNMAAATFLSNWRRQSKTTKNNNKTINCVNENNENNNKINNGYTLSELSHDVLAQIIRLFPFSSSLTPTPSSSSSSTTSTIINNNSSSTPSQRHIIYRALSQPNPTINTNLKCSSPLNEEKKKKEENKSLININKLNIGEEEILNNKISPKKQLLRDWHTRAGSSSLGRKLRRAASTFSGSKMIEGISSKERPKNLSIFGKSEKNSRKNGKSPTSCNGH